MINLDVKGFDDLVSGNFKKMIIRKNDNDYLVKVNNKKKERIFDNDNDALSFVIGCFVQFATLNQVGIKKVPFVNKLLFVANGNKKLSIEVSDDNLDNVYKTVVEKYLSDRNEYFENNKFFLYDISLNEDVSSYNADFSGIKDRAEIKLLHEDGELLSFEKKFLYRFVYKKLLSQGVKAEIIPDYEIYEPVMNQSDKCDEYFICCGDVSIRFSNDEEFLFLFGLVDRYNDTLEKGKRRVKKVGN